MGVRRLEVMTEFLRDASLHEVVMKFADEGRPFPAIPSKWHLENIAREEDRPRLLAARELGRVLVVRLDEWAQEMLEAGTVRENERMANDLVGLAEWIGSAEGYGNLFLEDRCRDIAVVGTGRIIADLDVSMDIGAALFGRLSDPGWYNPEKRARILNAEAGAELFSEFSARSDDKTMYLEARWGKAKGIVAMQEFLKLISEYRRSQLPENYKKLGRLYRWKLGRIPLTSPLRHNQAFFVEDEASPSSGAGIYKPLVKVWEYKQHRAITIFPQRAHYIKYLKALLEYREKIGFFPEEVVLSRGDIERIRSAIEIDKRRGAPPRDFESEKRRWANIYIEVAGGVTKAAFDRTWKDRFPDDRSYTAEMAAELYDKIRSGCFSDDDTLARAMARPDAPKGEMIEDGTRAAPPCQLERLYPWNPGRKKMQGLSSANLEDPGDSTETPSGDEGDGKE
jgi:hypothetical protein